jgi:hypothetical protein
MEKNTRLLALGTALILSGLLGIVVNIGSQVSAQDTAVDVENLKQILNATRTAIEANDIPGALTQLDLAEVQLSGGSNTTDSSNMTNATMTG